VYDVSRIAGALDWLVVIIMTDDYQTFPLKNH
jgi:hypothetical protein